MNEDGVILSPGGSPSKRWSPNKSSWIESALTRPDSPTKPAPLKNSQPSWMTNLAKANAKRASVDITPGPELRNIPGSVSKPESLATRSTPQNPPVADKFGSSATRSAATDSFTSTTSSITPAPLRSRANAEEAKPAPPIHDKPKSPLPSKQRAEDTKPQVSDTPPALSLKRAETSPAALTPTPAIKPLQRTGTNTTPVTDFRSALKSRAPKEVQAKAEPEFLAKFGNLRKTQQEKYVAPDLLKDNILRGKTGLAVTGGPVKSVIKDELKESLLAKKEDIKKAKDEGRELPGEVHNRKTSESLPNVVPKPEALAKRELLGRTDSGRTAQSAAPIVEAAPEALVRHKSLRKKSVVEQPKSSSENVEEAAVAMGSLSLLSKQASAPAAIEAKRAPESSKLAARFNPGLAGMLARGPPTGPSSRSESPASGGQTSSAAANTASGAPTSDQTLTDVRKDRAKGPKRRKAGDKSGGSEAAAVPAARSTTPQPPLKIVPTSQNDTTSAPPQPSITPSSAVRKNFSAPFRRDEASTPAEEKSESQPAVPKPKPQALPGSAAAIMAASLKKSPEVEAASSAAPAASKPSPRANFSKPMVLPQATTPSRQLPTPEAPAITVASANVDPVPEFKGFASRKTGASSQVQANTPKKISQENLPRSSSLQGQQTATGLGISVGDASPKLGSSTNVPPKPAKSSRIVSGSLADDPFKPGKQPLF
jgi:hypothetical protein